MRKSIFQKLKDIILINHHIIIKTILKYDKKIQKCIHRDHKSIFKVIKITWGTKGSKSFDTLKNIFMF